MPEARPLLPVFAPLACWLWLSWPKRGRSKAWLTVPTVRTRPSAPATTAMRWPMVLTDAALVRTACGSRLNDEPPKEPKAGFAVVGLAAVGCAGALRASVWSETRARSGAPLARPAAAVAAAAICAADFGCGAGTVGMAAVAGSGSAAVSGALMTGMAAVAGSASAGVSGALMTGMAAVGGPGVVESSRRGTVPDACSRSACARSAARRSARVMGAGVVGWAAEAGSGVVLSVPVTCPLGWARRRPDGLVRSSAIWARRG